MHSWITPLILIGGIFIITFLACAYVWWADLREEENYKEMRKPGNDN